MISRKWKQIAGAAVLNYQFIRQIALNIGVLAALLFSQVLYAACNGGMFIDGCTQGYSCSGYTSAAYSDFAICDYPSYCQPCSTSNNTINNITDVSNIDITQTAVCPTCSLQVNIPPPPPPPSNRDVVAAIDAMHVDVDLHIDQTRLALLNYYGASLMQDYLLKEQLIFMVAPGTNWAISAGQAIGGAASYATLASQSIQEVVKLFNFGQLTAAETVNHIYALPGTQAFEANPAPTPTPGTIYNAGAQLVGQDIYNMVLASEFVENGNLEGLAAFDSGNILSATNLSNTTAPISPALANWWVSLTVNPYPDATLASAIKAGTLASAGSNYDLLANQLVEYAIMSLSVNALSDVVGRRTAPPSPSSSPTSPAPASIMDVMSQYSGQQFTNPNWYGALSGLSQEALLREIAYMLAYQSWASYEQFKISEQQTAMVATMNAVMAKMNLVLAQTNQQTASAQSQAQTEIGNLNSAIAAQAASPPPSSGS